jgi:hypothetical protein
MPVSDCRIRRPTDREAGKLSTPTEFNFRGTPYPSTVKATKPIPNSSAESKVTAGRVGKESATYRARCLHLTCIEQRNFMGVQRLLVNRAAADVEMFKVRDVSRDPAWVYDIIGVTDQEKVTICRSNASIAGGINPNLPIFSGNA